MADGHLGPLGCTKFHLNRHGVGMRPQNIKSPLFGKESPRRGEPLTNFWNFMVFYTTNHPTLVFQIWLDSLHRLRSYCWETARRSIRPKFSVQPCRENYVLDRKMIVTFLMGTTSSITEQSLEKIVRRAPAVGAKMWCLLFVTSPEHSAFEGCIVQTSNALPFIGRFRRGFSAFFIRHFSFRCIT